MSDSICSLDQNTNTCFPEVVINTLSESFLNKKNINTRQSINELANITTCSKYNTLQEKELCIANHIINDNKDELGDVMKKQIYTFFKPKAKKLDKNYWLNNTEIDQIQNQLQYKYDGYYYSFIHMIDLEMFDPRNKDVLLNGNKIDSIKDINFVNEITKQNNKLTYNGDLKYYGIVCNTDVSNSGGIHWFSIFIDFTKKPITIEYFNSSGYSILNGSHFSERKNFSQFFHNIADELTKHGFDTEFIQVTNLEHQRHDTANCGSYSLYYIWSRLNGKDYKYFSKNKITDEKMEDFRKVLWRV